MPPYQDKGSAYDFEAIPLDHRRQINAELSKGRFQRTQDIAHPQIKTFKTATDTTAASWNLTTPVIVSRPSVLQLLLNGLPTTHPVYVSPLPPDDQTQPSGRFLSNAAGTAYLLQVGSPWFVYIPNQTGDPASFSALLFDASSELPAQLAALQAAASQTVVQSVQILNRASFQTDQLVTVTAGTPINYGTSQALPASFSLAMTALPSNTKNVSIGVSSARALYTSGHGQVLAPGMSGRLFISNWNQIWLDSQVSGEGISLMSEI